MSKVLPLIQLAGWVIIAGWLALRLSRLAKQYRAENALTLQRSDALLISLLALLALRCWAIEPYWVSSASMEPTLFPRDVILVLKRPLWRGSVKVGDIVILDDPTGRHRNLVKRVGSASEYGFKNPKDGQYYVFGDNRSNSADSRAYGPVLEGAIHGRALAIIFPPSRAKWIP